MPRLLPQDLRARAAFLALFVPLWIGADIVGTIFASGPGLSAWYVNAAFDVVLFAALGWGWWPLPVVLLVVSYVVYPHERWGSIQLNALAQTPYELILALTTQFALRRLQMSLPLRTVRDVAIFTGVVAGAGTAVANAAYVLAYNLVDPVANPWSQFAPNFVQGTIADMASIMALVPVITQFMIWRTPGASDDAELEPRFGRRFRIGLLITGAAVAIERVVAANIHRTLGEFSLVPLAWLAITFGMRGAAFGLLVTDVAASVALLYSRSPADSQAAYQGYLIATALLALLLGASATDRNGLLARLRRAAYIDSLTQLPNTGRLVHWVSQLNGRAATLAVVDIADMRVLNEGIGRESVDGMLSECATRLRTLGDDVFLAYIGPGEFAIATAHAADPSRLIASIHRALEAPFDVEGAEIFVETAIGVASTDTVADARELIRSAEISAQRAKSSPSRTAIYGGASPERTTPLLVVELHRAMQQGEFVPFFQPIYRHRVDGWQLCGAEVLMRWRHPQRGVLKPADFMELLTRLSICNRAGWAVLEESLRQAKEWRGIVPEFAVWVNFFPRQVFDPDCVRRVLDVLDATEAPAEALVVEITESVVASNELEVASIVEKLRTFGVYTAIDDFGTGGSSLARVREVPAHVLKIDRSFVNRSEVDPKAMSVAKTVVRLGSELGLEILAEGVENTTQLHAMLGIGAEYAQGYALGHPMPAEVFSRMLAESRAS